MRVKNTESLLNEEKTEYKGEIDDMISNVLDNFFLNFLFCKHYIFWKFFLLISQPHHLRLKFLINLTFVGLDYNFGLGHNLFLI